MFIHDNRYRENELKHGRVAMLAVLGVLIGESGFTFFGDEIAGPAIFQYQVRYVYMHTHMDLYILYMV